MLLPAGCSSRYRCQTLKEKPKKITFHRFPISDESLNAIWISKIPRSNWEWNDNSRRCSKHFSPSDYKKESSDSNRSQEEKDSKKLSYLQKRILKADAVPSIWPGLPLDLTKKPVKARPTTLALSTSREDNAFAINCTSKI